MIYRIFRQGRFLFSEYSMNNEMYFFYKDYHSEKIYNTKGGLEDDIYNSGKVILFPLLSDENQMYFIKNGYEVAGKINDVTENSNPVIMLVKLKE